MEVEANRQASEKKKPSKPGAKAREAELPSWLKVTGKPPAVRALLIVNTVAFAIMTGLSGIRSLFIPSSQVLLQFGASSGAATIIDGEFWRIYSSAFVHAGFLHLMMNCYIIWDVGPMVEKLYGSRKFIAIYVMSAMGAALSSLMVDPTVVSAGASGAIFGLLGALVAFFWRHRRRFPTGFLKTYGKIIGIFIVYGIAYGALMQGVDNAAHIGGLMSGFVVALALLPEAPGATSFRRQDGIMTAGLYVGLLAFLALDCQAIAGNGAVLGDSAYRQAVELLQNQRPAQAMPLLDRAVVLMPEIASVRRDRARALDQLGRREDALTDIDAAIRLDPRSKLNYSVRSQICHNLGKDKDSINDLSKAIDLDSGDAMAYNNRAWDYDAIGDSADAIKDSDKAIELDRNQSTFYDTRAVAYLLADRCEDALKDLNKASQLKKGDGAYSFHRAMVYDKLGQTQLAEAERKKAEALGYKPEGWELKAQPLGKPHKTAS